MEGGVGVGHPGAVLEPDRRALGVDDAVDLLLHFGLKRSEMYVQGSAERWAPGCQVARMLQAKPGRIGKQHQEQNSQNLGSAF